MTFSSLVVCGLIDRRKKKRLLFNVKDSSLFDKGDICLYQEVARMPPFARKCLILIGAHGVGRRTLKKRLIELYPDRFGTTKPRKNISVVFISIDRYLFYLSIDEFSSYIKMDAIDMENEIEAGGFLEHGLYGEHLYGTKFDSVNRVIQASKMCVLDIEPTVCD
jgi:MAGUK p55 subfamily member 2/6